MGISNTEDEILKELAELGEEANKEEKDTEELLEEIDSTEEDTEEEDDELEEDDEEDDDDDDEENVEEEKEEELTGAKFRHKLKAEKAAREKIQMEAQELRERLARLEGRAEATESKQEVKEAEIPDQEYEPERYAIWKAEQLEKKLQIIEQEQSRSNAERQWEKMQADYAKKSPTYNDAKQFLIDNEVKKIKEVYPYASDDQIAQHIKEQEYITAGNAAKAGIMPTEHIEFLAFQAGYRPSEKKEETISKKSNIQKIKKNAKKNASLIGASSATDKGDARSAEQLAAMSLEEITKFGRDKYEAAIRKIEARS